MFARATGGTWIVQNRGEEPSSAPAHYQGVDGVELHHLAPKQFHGLGQGPRRLAVGGVCGVVPCLGVDGCPRPQVVVRSRDSDGVEGVGRTRVASSRSRHGDVDVVPRPESGAVLRVHSGWPWHSFAATLRVRDMTAPGAASTMEVSAPWDEAFVLQGARAHDDPISSLIAVPFKPCWSGLALDAVLFGAIGALLLNGTRTIRGVLRRRNGRCASCAYPTPADSRTCPECGATTQ